MGAAQPHRIIIFSCGWVKWTARDNHYLMLSNYTARTERKTKNKKRTTKIADRQTARTQPAAAASPSSPVVGWQRGHRRRGARCHRRPTAGPAPSTPQLRNPAPTDSRSRRLLLLPHVQCDVNSRHEQHRGRRRRRRGVTVRRHGRQIQAGDGHRRGIRARDSRPSPPHCLVAALARPPGRRFAARHSPPRLVASRPCASRGEERREEKVREREE